MLTNNGCFSPFINRTRHFQGLQPRMGFHSARLGLDCRVFFCGEVMIYPCRSRYNSARRSTRVITTYFCEVGSKHVSNVIYASCGATGYQAARRTKLYRGFPAYEHKRRRGSHTQRSDASSKPFQKCISRSKLIFVVHVHVASMLTEDPFALSLRDTTQFSLTDSSRQRRLESSFYHDTLGRRIVPSPFPCNLLIAFPIILVLLRNPSLHGIVRHRLCQQLAGKLEDCCDLGAGFPLVRPQHAQTHAPFLIVRHVGVIDLRSEGDGGGLEGVFGG